MPGLAVSSCLVLVGLLILAVLGIPEAHRPVQLPWWVLAIVCGLCELVVLNIQVRREGHGISLSELGIVFGLFFCGPLAYLLARVIGPVLVFGLWRRQTPVKVLFNASLFFAESAVAMEVFRLIAGPDLAIRPLAWLGALAAAATSALLATLAVSAVIALVNGELNRRDLVQELLRGQTNAAWVSVIALVGVHALSADLLAGIPLAAAVILLMAGYRGYAGLSERHLSLERLYRFSHAVGSSPEVDAILAEVLQHAREVLRAEYAEVVFVSSEHGHQPLRVSSTADSVQLHRARLNAEEVDDPIWLEIVDGGEPRLIARGDRAARTFLARQNLPDAVLAPLQAESGIVGTIMVADRLGELRTFGPDDVQLLMTVANHASMALQKGRLVDRLRHDALHDSLTGLPNRTLLNREIGAALSEVRAGRSPGTTVMIMDLVGFKRVNDTFGHQLGDRLLRQVGERMAIVLDDRGVLARLGGDEFAAVLPRLGDVAGALDLADRVRASMEQPIAVEGVDVEVGVSVGVAVAPEHGTDGQTLIKRADAAMYDAKKSGTGVHLYEQGLESSDGPQHLALVAELRHGINIGELRLYVQPQMSLVTGRVVGVEALARWAHPRHGLLFPDTFIPLAERTGLIKQLTDEILEQSIAAAGRWRREGTPLTMAVNLSARARLTDELVDDVGARLRRHGLPAQSLTLEITESSVINDPARTGEVLSRLHDLGIRLSIDDFGTGYSSLSYLRQLPVQEVKVDKSFVMTMLDQPEDAAIVRSIVDLGRNLGLDVVAEGVEDAHIEDELRRCGCPLMQGFHLAPPMPVEQFSDWLATREGRPIINTRHR